MDVAARAREIVEPLRETTDASEAARCLDPRAAELLREAELSKIMTPASHGGYEMSPRALIEAERIIAHGCTAASWVLMVTGAHTFIAGRLPEGGLDEVFADPGVLIPGVPSTWPGRASKVDGGFKVNGRWGYASGADHGPWLIAGAHGDDSCEPQLVFLPRTEASFDDTWFTLGMRGTGSKDMILEDVFIPEHRAVPARAAELGLLPNVDSGLYRLPIQCTLATMLMGSVVGIADRILETTLEQNRTRRDAYTGDAKRDSPGLQRRVAEASSEIECAWALVQSSCDLLEEAIVAADPMSRSDRAPVRWNAAYGAELCVRATDRLFAAAGSGAAADKNPLQRLGRDMHTAARHAMLDLDNAAAMQGKAMFDIDQSDNRV